MRKSTLAAALGVMVLTIVSCQSSVQQRVDPQPKEISAIQRLWIGGADGQCVAEVVAAVRSSLPQVTLVERPESAEAILLGDYICQPYGGAAARLGRLRALPRRPGRIPVAPGV